MLAGVNNEVNLFSMMIKTPADIKLQLIQGLKIGTTIYDMKVIENVIVIADMMRAIFTLDFREHK